MHRQRAVTYANSIQRRCQQELVHPSRLTAFAFDSKPDSKAWKAIADEALAWPPPAPGTEHDLTRVMMARRPKVALQLAESAGRFCWQLRSWLRPHFLDEAFLGRAQTRYVRFLRLRGAHPDVTLVPAADIALVWHTHLGLGGHYAAACREWLGPQAGSWEPGYLELERSRMVAAYGDTARLYEQMYGEPYSCPDTAWLPDLEAFPLLSPAGPLAFVARAFRDNPCATDYQSGLHTAAMNAALAGGSVGRLFPPPGREPPRSGAHALYAAWLASACCGRFFDEHTCGRLCFTRSWSIRVGTVERMAMVLVALAHMRYLVDSSDHPFLRAIRLRRGLWRPEQFRSREGQEGAGETSHMPRTTSPVGALGTQPAHPGAPSSPFLTSGPAASVFASEPASPFTTVPAPAPASVPAGMFSGSGFTNADMESFLDDPAMTGLAALLDFAQAARAPSIARGGSSRGIGRGKAGSGKASSGKAGSGKRGENAAGQEQQQQRRTPPLPAGAAPLWSILLQPPYSERPRQLFDHLWRASAERGVGCVLTYSEEELFYPKAVRAHQS